MIAVFVPHIFGNYSPFLFSKQHHIRLNSASRVNDMARADPSVMPHTSAQHRQPYILIFALMHNLNRFGQEIEIGKGITRPNEGISTHHTGL